MRKLPAAIVLSMASHAAAFAWVVRDGGVRIVPLRAAPAATVDPRPAAPPDSEPIAVVFLDDHRAPTPAPRDAAPDRTPPQRRAIATSAARGHEPPRGAPAISTGTTRGDELPRGEPANGAPARSPWMTMRGPERPGVVGLSPEFVADFLAHSRPVPPPPDIPGERIGDEIAELRKQLRHGPGAGGLQQLVALNDQRAAEELGPAGGGTYRADKETFTAKVDADGKVHLKDKPGKLDTQDKMMLRMGIDPYGRNKLAFLDRTRDQRAAVGERHNRAQLAHATELMQKNIDRLWEVTSELAARKAGLFALWDDCAEAGSDELVAGGAAARGLVIGVIRARLRGDDAYTAAELAQLNAQRRSTAVFAPYE